MKAVICTKYGSPEVLEIREVEKPIPGKNEVCIKVHATAVTASDIYIRSLNLPLRYRIPMRIMLGFSRPRRSIIGLVLSGEIESVGTDIKRFKPEDQVYGLTGFGLGAQHTIDYTKEDTLNTGIQYDFVLDAVGKMKTSKLKVACKNALSSRGKYVSIDD
jgi:NADPH:quinone reductase-like Zn-dependent oxidoreductase